MAQLSASLSPKSDAKTSKAQRKRRSSDTPQSQKLPVAPELRPELDPRLWADAELRAELVKKLAESGDRQENADLFLTPGVDARAAKTAEGWRLTTNPLDLYRTDTPWAALRAFVWASTHGRWATLLALAPARFRAVFTAEELKAAWTDGPGSDERRALRDEIAASLDRVVVLDADGALLVTDTGQRVRLEREAGRWVVAGY